MEEKLKENFLKLVEHTAGSRAQLNELQIGLNNANNMLNECRWILVAIAVFTAVIMCQRF
jgi:hypothetical protein